MQTMMFGITLNLTCRLLKNKEVPMLTVIYCTFSSKLLSLIWCHVNRYFLKSLPNHRTDCQGIYVLSYGCSMPSFLLRFVFTESFLDAQRSWYMQGGIRAGETLVHVGIISDVLCWITCFLSQRKAPEMVNLEQPLKLWNGSRNSIRDTLQFVTPVAFWSLSFGWKRRNPTGEALAFKADKQIYLRGFSGHLNHL